MPGKRYNQLVEIAADQRGFVTTRDAEAHGIPADTLVKMAKRGTIEAVATGLYRLPGYPRSRNDDLMEAALWPYGRKGVVSHETALRVYGLSDVSPDRIHITVPGYRHNREAPARIALHTEPLAADEIQYYADLPIVTPIKAIRQAHADRLGPALISQAIEDGVDQGYFRQRVADELRAELLGR